MTQTLHGPSSNDRPTSLHLEGCLFNSVEVQPPSESRFMCSEFLLPSWLQAFLLLEFLVVCLALLIHETVPKDVDTYIERKILQLDSS